MSAGVINGLIDEGTLETVVLPPEPVAAPPDPDHARAGVQPMRSARRRSVARERGEGRLFGVALIDGVTGSGKTEVYFEAVAETVRQGRQVLILMPEIALPRNSSTVSRSASACRRRNGTRSLRRASARAPGRRWR